MLYLVLLIIGSLTGLFIIGSCTAAAGADEQADQLLISLRAQRLGDPAVVSVRQTPLMPVRVRQSSTVGGILRN